MLCYVLLSMTVANSYDLEGYDQRNKEPGMNNMNKLNSKHTCFCRYEFIIITFTCNLYLYKGVSH